MNWIKPAVAAAVLVLTGCASTAPVIPQNGPDMKTIYRQALNGAAPTAVFASEARALCTAMPVRTPLDDCTRQAQAILTKQRLAVAANSPQQSLDYVPYTRDATDEVARLFPRMPNPDLVIYIYPHLATRTRAPIPGYTSVIPLFDRVEYQLPGEIAPLD